MMNTLHASLWIVANVCESSLSSLNSSFDLAGGNHYRKMISLSLDFFRILIFRFLSLYLFPIAIFSPYFLLAGLLLKYVSIYTIIIPLRWRHNRCNSVSNHQPHHCLLNRLFRRKSKKTSKLRVTGLSAGNSSGTGEFPAQMASYTENVSTWWRHHAKTTIIQLSQHGQNFVFLDLNN